MSSVNHDHSQEQAIEVLLRLLGMREHSAHELEQKLRQRGFANEVIKAALNHVQQRGWQSDARFCELWVRSCLQRGHGRQRIFAAGVQKGLAATLVEQALAAEAPDWGVQCYQRLLKKFGAQPPQDARQRDKIIRHLLGQGFTYGQIKQALAQQTASADD